MSKDVEKNVSNPKKVDPMVIHSNALSEASYTLTLTEQRLILMAISMIRKGEEVTGKTPFLISAKDYSTIFSIGINNAYRDLMQAEKSLFNRVVWLYESDDEEGMEFTKTRWIQSVTYKKAQGEISLRFAEKIIPYISDLESSELTVAYLSEMSGLTSFYAIRLYAMLIQWRSVGRLNISVEEFRTRLELNSAGYNQISNLKTRVIDIAMKQINERTSMVVDCEYVKTRRTITGMVFSFKDSRELVGWSKAKNTKNKDPQLKKSSENNSKIRNYEEFMQLSDQRKTEFVDKFVQTASAFVRFAFNKKGLGFLEEESFRSEFCKWMEFEK